jgi:hypothetical protein
MDSDKTGIFGGEIPHRSLRKFRGLKDEIVD